LTGRAGSGAARLLALALALLASALLAPPLAAAGDGAPVRYRVEPDVVAGTWSVRATVPRSGAGDLVFVMPRWTAGAYHLAEYGRFVTRFAARDAAGTELPVTREGHHRFVVAAGEADPVTLEWSARECAPLDVNENMILDVEGNRLTPEYGYLSPNSLLGFVLGEVDRPCELELFLPEGWRGASALERRDDGVLVAPSWWRLEDSPILFAPRLHSVHFEVDGIAHEVCVYGKDAAETQALADRCRRIVEAGRDWMMELPYPRYAFLFGFVPESLGGGSGLEHGDSTLILLTPGPELDGEVDQIIAHEFFHLWCAERIHVAALQRPDYTLPLETGTIWLNEGVTEYFSRHLLVRAGLSTREEFFDGLWRSWSQARALWAMVGERSWTDVSRAAAGWSDMSDLIAFSIKNYQGGCWTVFGLDLAMRRASDGERGVADLLRYLDRAYARAGRGVGESELIAICEGIAQGELDAYFARHIDGPELPDLHELLAVIGCTTKGGMKRIEPVAEPTPQQQAALEDFFSLPPARR